MQSDIKQPEKDKTQPEIDTKLEKETQNYKKET